MIIVDTGAFLAMIYLTQRPRERRNKINYILVLPVSYL
jgi:hypothetical protein